MSDPTDLYADHDPADLPPELQPLRGVPWTALDTDAVQDVVDELPDEHLADVPGPNRLARGVLALGIGVRSQGRVAPTLAGLLAFGLRPARLVPGLTIEVDVDGHPTPSRSGSSEALMEHVTTHRALDRRLDAPLRRGLLAHALVWRSWTLEDAGESVILSVASRELAIHVPGQLGGEVTNPVLAELLWRRGWGLTRDAGRRGLAEALRAAGFDAPEVETRRGWSSWTLRRAEASSSDGSAARPPRPSRREAAVVETPRGSASVLASPGEPPGTYRAADDRRTELLAMLTAQGRLTRRELQRRLGWSRSTLRDVLRAAVDAGAVRALAEDPRSPFQAYEAA